VTRFVSRMRRPSPAFLIAMLALLVALAGSAAAGSALITSRDIKNGTIQLVDLNKHTRAQLTAHALTADRSAWAARLDDVASASSLVASSTPLPGALLPLDANGQLPESALPLDSTTKAPNIAARVYSSQDEPAHIQIAFGPVQRLTFDKVSFDTAQLFDPRHPSQLTISTPGIYLITSNVSWAVQNTSLSGINRAVYVYVNDHTIAVDQRPPAAETRQVVTTVYQLNRGDTVEVGIGQDAGDLTANAVGDYAPSLAVVWLAPG
jgi:hypothetical protein